MVESEKLKQIISLTFSAQRVKIQIISRAKAKKRRSSCCGGFRERMGVRILAEAAGKQSRSCRSKGIYVQVDSAGGFTVTGGRYRSNPVPQSAEFSEFRW